MSVPHRESRGPALAPLALAYALRSPPLPLTFALVAVSSNLFGSQVMARPPVAHSANQASPPRPQVEERYVFYYFAMRVALVLLRFLHSARRTNHAATTRIGNRGQFAHSAQISSGQLRSKQRPVRL